MKRIFAWALLGLFLLSGCSEQPENIPENDTLVVATMGFEGKFSPFFYLSAYDNQIIQLTQLYLLETDREGAVVLQGIEGETRPYGGKDYTYRGIADCAVTQQPDGKVRYDITLRQGLRFSDGEAVTADDVLFSLYVALDPSYDGTLTLYSLPIEGLDSYRNGDERSVSGIRKTGENTLQIILTQPTAGALEQLSIPVAPLHYYGSDALFSPENQMFGFQKGDLSKVRGVTAAPLGGGPYKFVSYTGGKVTLERNDLYWKGAPKIRYIQFREGQEGDKLTALLAGTADITSPAYSTETARVIEKAGEKMHTVLAPNLGYGYVGLNAKTVCVDGKPGSAASKNLRKALATVLAVYRDVAVDSYYGSFASVIHYPISVTSWAAPHPTDEGYREAFSRDVNGGDIYTPGMTPQERYEAAKNAALGYFRAAGYTVKNGKLTAAPKGAKLRYEALIGAGGTGDHPTFMALTLAKEALRDMGMELIVTDLSQFSQLTSAVNTGKAELFSMAWKADADPDLYQVYHSQGASNSYGIEDPDLDKMILMARSSSDRGYRKLLYRSCLDIIGDWAVEVPMYQRQNATVFSPQRVDISSVTADITPFWEWTRDIETLRLR